MWTYRRHWSAWNVKVMMTGAVLGIGSAGVREFVSGCGDRADRRRDRPRVRAQCLARPAARPLHAADSRPPAAAGVFWGATSAFMSTPIQAGAPPFQVFVLPQRCDKLTLVGTIVIFFAVET